MTGRPREGASEHYDLAKSKGAVRNDEIILFVVFKAENVANDGKLKADAFDPRRLSKANESIARLAFTPKSDLMTFVIDPASQRQETCVGIAQATAECIREIEITSVDRKRKCLAFCILDVVSANDADGHGVMSFSDTLKTLETKGLNIAKAKSAARHDLATRFSIVRTLSSIYPDPMLPSDVN
ncbi:hypothetical protein [Lichenicoccus sp.]|uniref:hypothetical protein n=1 Tax=Lichenicoccus sp. TaxID=2781899 RepID=UPI003D099593